jgi:hypothetical protein
MPVTAYRSELFGYDIRRSYEILTLWTLVPALMMECSRFSRSLKPRLAWMYSQLAPATIVASFYHFGQLVFVFSTLLRSLIQVVRKLKTRLITLERMNVELKLTAKRECEIARTLSVIYSMASPIQVSSPLT